MDKIKSAEEILKEHTSTIEDGFFPVETVHPGGALQAMQEYADQFKPKWIEGVPDDKRDVILLDDTGCEWRGYYDGEDFIPYPHATPCINVVAYREVQMRPIPDHLKAKIK